MIQQKALKNPDEGKSANRVNSSYETSSSSSLQSIALTTLSGFETRKLDVTVKSQNFTLKSEKFR